MDGWFDDDDDGWAIRSSGSLSSEPIDAYWGSLCSDDSSCAPGLSSRDLMDYLELRDSNLIEQQFYQAQISINMETNQLFPEDFIQQKQSEEFVLPNQSQTSSKSLPLQSLSTGSTEYSYLLVNNANATTTKQATKPNYDTYNHLHFGTPSSDDVEIMKAMAAVISSSSSSSSSSTTHPMLQAQTHERSQVNDRFGAFKPYNSGLAPKFEPKMKYCGQEMIKMSFSMWRRINSMRGEAQTQESRSVGNQLQHIISERKRREKLNGSFHALRLLLPLGSKKDKGSVLANTKNYLNTLKAQISKLQKENRALEMHLSPTSKTKGIDGMIEKVKVQIVKGFKLISGVQQIEFEISVTVECDVIELVLQMLEYLKVMRISLISLDVNMCSPRRDLFVHATVKLEIKDSNWDERSFKETMNRAVDGMTTAP